MRKLNPSELKNFYPPSKLGFFTTSEIQAFDGIIGQQRAESALSFGLAIKKKGYNIYVSGAPGTGKTSFSENFARKAAANEPVPNDICYIYNFENPKTPKALFLPPGQAKLLKHDMDELIERLANELPKVFNTRDFEQKKSEIVKQYQVKRDILIKDLTAEARAQDFGVKTTSSGIYFMPIVADEIINEEQYEELSPEQKDQISGNSEAIQKHASEIMRQIKEYEKCTRNEVENLEYGVGLFAVGYHINPLINKYGENKDVTSYLLAVKEDILVNISDFVEEERSEEENLAYLPWYPKKNGDEPFAKYKVNVLTDNSELNGAPVIIDFNPTYSNLVGEVEYDNEFGNFTTDFMKIKPGLLHRANGGYLILQIRDVLANIHSWEALRRVLLTGELLIEPLREFTTGIAVSGIKPEPVKINIKIILVGIGYYYDLMYEIDDEFQKLFKIRADFDYEMNRNDDNIAMFTQFIKKFVDKEGSKEFDNSAALKLIEYASRLAERQDKMTTRFNKINDILYEASALADLDNMDVITAKYVDKAIAEKKYRLGMYEDKLTELIENEMIMINTTGSKLGEINGLCVIDAGDYSFGKPSKITATVYVGKAGIINIEKEAEMSGNIHDKGISVLTGYIGQTYAQDFPLSLSARVCFEQNYNGIDGDSASSTELYAILSMLAGLPINQELAVTGSINQRGEIQPIGGVTQKIEGFFDLCASRGLTGNQGVIIPVQNIVDLVLKDEVVDAVSKNLFTIYAISHIDEGIELLTGAKAGKKNDKTKFPADSVHGLVMKRLKEYYKKSIEQ